MYKNLILLGCLLPFAALAQNVGVGSKTPATRLHVVDSNNNVQLRVETPTLAGDEASIRLGAGTNPFSFFQLSKYAPGATGTFAGVSKDNLSVLSTGGNGGALMLATGDGTSPLLFAAGAGEHMRIVADGRVGIGTTAPTFSNRLHVHSTDPTFGGDVSIGITNTFTTDASGRGARIRLNNFNLVISNNEATGNLSLATNQNQRVLITPAGNIGINNLSPNYWLDIAATNNNSRAINVAVSDGLTNTVGIRVNNPNNAASFIPVSGIHATVGSGAPAAFSPILNYGLIGESLNLTQGFGVLGISNSPSATMSQAGVVGLNFSNDASAYGVMGKSSGISGAGVMGYTENFTAGVLGVADPFSNGPAVKAVVMPGSVAVALELENGALKVSGTKRTVFRHTTAAGNTIANETTIPNTTFANNPNDLLIVTPFWDGVYVNSPIGVYFDAPSSTWRIFRQDTGAMPLNAKFNVMVVKQ
jgi:hypothetical protein